MNIEELEKKYGFKQGQLIFIDGGTYIKDECGRVSYQENNDGFFYKVVHSNLYVPNPVGSLVECNEDCLNYIEKMNEEDIDSWGKN